MADRHTYLPSLGLFFIIGLGAAKLYEKAKLLKRWRAISHMASLFVALIMLASRSYATIKQIGIWKDSTVFWDYVADKSPSSPLAHNNLGNVYLSEDLFDMAIEQYRTALILKTNYAAAHYNLGNAYASKGIFDMAIEQYQNALVQNPNNAEAHYNLGLIYLNNGSQDRARVEFELGLKIKPDDYKARQILTSIMSK